jgi:diacylglycerol kinase family enzyme
VVVFVNPHSRANRRNPKLAERFARTLGPLGRVVAAHSLEELAEEARRLAAAPPSLIAIHGGDGTLHRTVGALIRAFRSNPLAPLGLQHDRSGSASGLASGPPPPASGPPPPASDPPPPADWAVRPLPPLAILPGGTMNVVARSLGVHANPTRTLAALAADLRAGRPAETLVRRCLRVGDSFGFVFGNGLMANFLEEYYSKAGYGPLRAMWILARTFFSALIRGPFARRMFRSFAGQVWVDGKALPFSRLTGLGAATVREVGLGFKLNHRADEDPDRFSVLAIHAGPVALAADLVPVHQGRGIAPKRAWSAVASTLSIEPEARRWSYTIDGDLYRAEGRVDVQLGPPLHIVRPRTRRRRSVDRAR